MSRVVRILDQGQSGPVMHLCAQHKGQHLPRHLWIQVHDALDILYGIAVSVSVPLSAVHQTRRPAPDKRREALERVPGVDHRVKVLVRGADLQVLQFTVPVTDQLLQFLLCRPLGVRVTVHDLLRFKHRLLSQQESRGLLFARLQRDAELERTAGIGIVVQAVVTLAVQHRLRTVKPVPSEELLPPSRIACHRRPGQAEETLAPRRSVRIRIVVLIDLFQDEAVVEFRLRDELRILHVHQVLGIEAFGRQLGIAEYADLSGLVRQVLQADPPDLMGRSHGDIIQGLAADPVVLADDLRIAGAVMAFRFILLQRFGHRLPAGGPEIAGLFIPQVDISSGLVKLVERIPEDPSGSPALDETVSAGIGCHDCTVFR